MILLQTIIIGDCREVLNFLVDFLRKMIYAICK